MLFREFTNRVKIHATGIIYPDLRIIKIKNPAIAQIWPYTYLDTFKVLSDFQLTRRIDPMLIYYWATVYDAGPALNRR